MSWSSYIGAGIQKAVEAADARKKAEAQQKADEQFAERQRQYETYYEPKLQEYSQLGQQASGNVLEREMAKLRMRLGYNQSAGAGTGGWWDLAKLGMETAGMQKGQDIANQWKMWEGTQWQNYMNREDQQAYGLQMADLRYRQQLELMRQQAELNDPSWWESLGSVVGMGLGMWGNILPIQSVGDLYKSIAFQF